ncbi:uncharacterized protein G2W53_029140 [Senna tora]|uniref:Uncharacterized protein n=1 Tax=Senna tora TaxID=362788 RepID=A0A834T4X6_9FABA|nr:uncharacterized protein G2W53_029140 [Senna tora]
MHNIDGEREQVEEIVGTLNGSMGFWYSGSGGRYGTSKEKSEVFVCMRGTTNKADVFRVMDTSWLRQLASDVGLLKPSIQPSNSAYEIIFDQAGGSFLPSVEGSPPLTLSLLTLTPGPCRLIRLASHKDNT